MKFREIDIKRFQHNKKLEEPKEIKKHLIKRYAELKKQNNDTGKQNKR